MPSVSTMTAKQIVLVLSTLVLGLCVVVVLPVAYVSYRNYASYQTDLDTLTSTATKLGYTPDRKLNFYEARALTYDILVLVFYTPDSLDQFSAKVQSLGFVQSYFFEETINRSSESFLEEKVNWGIAQDLPDRHVTLNNYYERKEFSIGPSFPGQRPPLVTEWDLDNPIVKRNINIHYGRPPKPTDVWLYGVKPLPGNVVVVSLRRPFCNIVC